MRKLFDGVIKHLKFKKLAEKAEVKIKEEIKVVTKVMGAVGKRRARISLNKNND